MRLPSHVLSGGWPGTINAYEFKCITALLRLDFGDLPRSVVKAALNSAADPSAGPKTQREIIALARETLHALVATENSGPQNLSATS